jgi:predicted nuclease of predicted toxin-antitoxin system
MKLLLDENLSRRLVPFLQDAYPGSSQVVLLGLERANDYEVWRFAGEHGFVLVTQDADFYDLSLARGLPPPVLWVRAGNVSKSTVLQLLIERAAAIKVAFEHGAACVELVL